MNLLVRKIIYDYMYPVDLENNEKSCEYSCHSVFGPVGIRIYGVTFHKITIFSTIYILFDSH